MSGSDGLFHIGPDGDLVSMFVTPFAAETDLQRLVETHPDLLAGGQMVPESPRRWALVKREQGVPDRDDAGTRWSVDHLFVDQDAVPTLVEVKRSSDTRIRREVVGRMLDYAANGVRYWPIESLERAFDDTQRDLGNDPAETIASLCDDHEMTVSEFFAAVGDNLRAGRIRMVFLADQVPDELMRITEFLNEQMSPAEVFAVEVKQYRAAGHGATVIVPAVYGRTAAASRKTAPRRSIDRAAALAASTPATLRALELVDAFAAEHGLVVHRASGGANLKTPGRGSVANVYLADWDSFEVPLEPLRERGWVREADALHAELSGLTSKTLTWKWPVMPTDDAVANWERLCPILLTVAELYRSIEEPPRAG